MKYRLIREEIDKAVKKTGKTKTAISYVMTDGESNNWLTNRLREKGYQTLTETELEQLAGLLKVEPGTIARPEGIEEQRASKDSTGDLVVMVRLLSQIASGVNAIQESLDALQNGSRKIPVTRRERAVELLRKELISKSGGGVKVEEFKKLLTQASIGSSYMQDAINELGCKKMLANNGISYIVKEEN